MYVFDYNCDFRWRPPLVTSPNIRLIKLEVKVKIKDDAAMPTLRAVRKRT